MMELDVTSAWHVIGSYYIAQYAPPNVAV